MTDAAGTVIALDQGYAIVKMDETGCGRCHEDGGCGGNNLGKMFCSTPRTFRVRNTDRAAIGQRVRVEIPDGAVRHSASIAYGLPLAALFVGAIGGSAIAGDTGGVVGAIVGLAVSWFALWRSQTSKSQDERFQPSIRT